MMKSADITIVKLKKTDHLLEKNKSWSMKSASFRRTNESGKKTGCLAVGDRHMRMGRRGGGGGGVRISGSGKEVKCRNAKLRTQLKLPEFQSAKSSLRGSLICQTGPRITHSSVTSGLLQIFYGRYQLFLYLHVQMRNMYIDIVAGIRCVFSEWTELPGATTPRGASSLRSIATVPPMPECRSISRGTSPGFFRC